MNLSWVYCWVRAGHVSTVGESLGNLIRTVFVAGGFFGNFGATELVNGTFGVFSFLALLLIDGERGVEGLSSFWRL